MACPATDSVSSTYDTIKFVPAFDVRTYSTSFASKAIGAVRSSVGVVVVIEAYASSVIPLPDADFLTNTSTLADALLSVPVTEATTVLAALAVKAIVLVDADTFSFTMSLY
jgi:hypothetical protein